MQNVPIQARTEQLLVTQGWSDCKASKMKRLVEDFDTRHANRTPVSDLDVVTFDTHRTNAKIKPNAQIAPGATECPRRVYFGPQ